MPSEDHGKQRASSSQRVIRLGVSVNQGQPRVGRGRPRTRNNSSAYSSPDGLYVISVAARLLEMHPQTLRKYERSGLVRPSRTVGMLRLYSEEDIVRLRLIKHLVGDLGLIPNTNIFSLLRFDLFLFIALLKTLIFSIK